MEIGESGLNCIQAIKSAEIAEVPIKKPEDVIGFLREFNFGNRDERARKAVVRFLRYIRVRGNEDLLQNEPSLAHLIIDELEKAGFIKPGIISHEEWTKEAEQALRVALEDFEKRSKEWQVKVSETHEDWRP